MSKTFQHILIAAAAMTMAACSTTDEPTPAPTPEPGTPTKEHLTTYVSLGLPSRSETILEWQPETASRSGKGPIDAIQPDIIGTYGYNNIVTGGVSYSGIGEIFANTPMCYRKSPYWDMLVQTYGIDESLFDDGDLWLYKDPVNWRSGAKYLFFAYAPYNGLSDRGESVEAQTPTFDGFDRFMWSFIARYSAYDHMLSNKIISYESYTDGTANPHQQVYMTHLQARLRFCFRLGEEYGKQRIIHLKKMSLINLRGRTLTMRADYSRVGLFDDIELWSRDDGDIDDFDYDEPLGYLLKEVKWTYDSDISEIDYDKELFNERDPETNIPYEYIVLSKDHTEMQPLASVYVYPGERLNKVQISVEYDVYDLEGQLIRQNDHAISSIDLTSFQPDSYTGPMTGMRRLAPGYYYDVNIVVEPTYLYSLSDNDLDADGAIVIAP